MFGRLIVGIGWLAIAVYLANAGVAMSGRSGLTIQRTHLMGGLTATMLIAFAHVWLAIYFTGVTRMFRERGYLTALRSLSIGQRMAILVTVLALGNFVLGVKRLGGSLEGWLHTSLVWLCFVVQIVALILEWRAVRSAVEGIAVLRAEVQGDDIE